MSKYRNLYQLMCTIILLRYVVVVSRERRQIDIILERNLAMTAVEKGVSSLIVAKALLERQLYEAKTVHEFVRSCS